MTSKELSWRNVLRVLGVLGFIFGLLASVFTSDTAIIFIQNEVALPGKTIEVGSARFSKDAKWILLSSRSKSGAGERLYGLLPVFHQYGPSGRYFSFRYTTDSRVRKFVITESSAYAVKWVDSLLSDDQIFSLQRNCERIFIDQYKQMSLKCLIENHVITYLPKLNIEIIESIDTPMDTLPTLIP